MKKNYRVGSYEEFRNHLYAILRGEHKVTSDEPKIWYEVDPKLRSKTKRIQSSSSRSGSKSSKFAVGK